MAPTAVSRPFASAFGSIVHALLEHFIKEGTLELNAYARRSLIEAYAIHQEFDELYAEAVSQCDSVTQSDVWGTMLEGAVELKTEVAIASIDAEQRLVRERLDLVIVKASETWIVDYKSATELQDYSEQLGRYRQRWSAIDPSRKLRSFVLSTSNVELIEVT
jgi:ATP-dependent exoDNAse (exonuclease V) beta subunit